jgi:predicted TIM-barrel fold metal-dependent hydrolase
MAGNLGPTPLSRRRLLQNSAVTGAATVGGLAAARAFAFTPVTPNSHPMASRYFIIDGVAHCYNHAATNKKVFQDATNSINTSMSYHVSCTPERYRMTPAQYNRDWSPEDVLEQAFLESDEHMICMHSVAFYDVYKEGLVANWKGAYLKKTYPDRCLWYGTVNPSDPQALAFAELDRIAADGADGLKLYPSLIQGAGNRKKYWMMDDEKIAFPIFERARRNGIKHIAVHKVLGYTGPETSELGINDIALAAAAFPDLTFHIVHGGWLLIDETAALMKRHENVTAVMEGPLLWPLYDMERFHRMMRVFMTQVDIDRIIYGSSAANQHPYWITTAFMDYQPPDGAGFRITEDQKFKILGGNLARYHGVDIPSRRAKIADDRFARIKARDGLREPFLKQRTGVPT